MANEPDLVAKPAVKRDALLKVMAWGDPGAGKTRLGLSFPAPVVADGERGSTLYADEFSFWVAEPTPARPFYKVVLALVDQIAKGLYPDRATLVIDPITDFLDQLEAAIIADLAAKGLNLENLTGMKRAQAYAQVNDRIRVQLDKILALPVHVVFVARAKNVWGQTDKGMAPVGRTYDSKEIVEYLCDVVLHVQKGGSARVVKARLRDLPPEIKAVEYGDLREALLASKVEAPPVKAAPAKATPAPATVPAASAPATPPAPTEAATPAAVGTTAPATPEAGPQSAAVVSDKPTARQLAKLAMERDRLFGKGEDDHTWAADWLTGTYGRAIASLKDLTFQEASKTIDLWSNAKSTKDLPAPVVADLEAPPEEEGVDLSGVPF